MVTARNAGALEAHLRVLTHIAAATTVLHIGLSINAALSTGAPSARRQARLSAFACNTVLRDATGFATATTVLLARAEIDAGLLSGIANSGIGGACANAPAKFAHLASSALSTTSTTMFAFSAKVYALAIGVAPSRTSRTVLSTLAIHTALRATARNAAGATVLSIGRDIDASTRTSRGEAEAEAGLRAR